MNSNKFLSVAVIAAVIVVAAAGAFFLSNDDGGSDTGAVLPQPGLISATQYQTLFAETGQAHYLLDVRTVEEFQTGHIDGAANIAVEILDRYLSDVPTDIPVVVYCRSGNRSATAAQILRSAGYAAVYDIDGGIIQWQAEGLTLVQ